MILFWFILIIVWIFSEASSYLDLCFELSLIILWNFWKSGILANLAGNRSPSHSRVFVMYLWANKSLPCLLPSATALWMSNPSPWPQEYDFWLRRTRTWSSPMVLGLQCITKRKGSRSTAWKRSIQAIRIQKKSGRIVNQWKPFSIASQGSFASILQTIALTPFLLHTTLLASVNIFSKHMSCMVLYPRIQQEYSDMQAMA